MKQRKIEYPGGGAWVLLPPEWLGKHMVRRDQVVEGLDEKVTRSLQRVAISLAIVDDFEIPGIGKRQEEWDFDEISVNVLQWLINSVYMDFGMAFIVPKKKSPKSRSGQKVKTAKTTGGSSGKKKSV